MKYLYGFLIGIALAVLIGTNRMIWAVGGEWTLPLFIPGLIWIKNDIKRILEAGENNG